MIIIPLDRRLRPVPAVFALAVILAGTLPTLAPIPARAQPPVLGDQAQDCDISRALGIRLEGCSRGLAIGGPAGMPEQAPAAPPATPTDPAAPPSLAPRPAPEFKAAFKINFEFGSARLTADAQRLLDKIAQVLNAPAAASLRFRVAGHTDSVGSASRNQQLSQQRAQAVVTYLSVDASHPLAATRLEAVGKGSSEPLIPANPAAGENRRVEITNLGR